MKVCVEVKAVNQIIDWLKTNGEVEMDGANCSYRCIDEPYMEFSAEWQDWNDNESWSAFQKLYIGYFTIINGDICHDPQYEFTITEGEVSQIVYSNSFLQFAHLCKSQEDQMSAEAFARLVFERHMEKVVGE